MDHNFGTHNLGNGINVRIERFFIEVWRNGGILFRSELDTLDYSPDLRQIVVDLVEKYKAQKGKTAICFGISRQTLDNWIASFKQLGIIGLINNTKTGVGRKKGNKAREHEQLRSEQKQEALSLQPSLFDTQPPVSQVIDKEEEPFSIPIAKEENRYAGQIIYQILLSSKWMWFSWIIGYFGNSYKIFQVFLLMVGKNIASIEQLKNVIQSEGGRILGIKNIPSLPMVWSWFHEVAVQKSAKKMSEHFMGWQIRMALVGTNFWFTDGHSLPYSGGEKLRKLYNTKRRLVEPGRTNLVTCDLQGRIVEYDIQEGQGDLRGRILTLHQKWKTHLQEAPVQVFDREGNGAEFFYGLVSARCPFITWEKNADQAKLAAFEETKFTETFTFNDTKYSFFETEKKFVVEIIENQSPKTVNFSLRRFYVCNTKTGKRTSVLANNADLQIDKEDCVIAILQRWGASENTFKYLKSKHPLHYQPGFKYKESENQLIDNPEAKTIEKEITKLKKELQSQYKELSKKEKQFNKGGELRKNDIYTQLKEKIAAHEIKVNLLSQQKKELPQKIDVSGLENYSSYKAVDNEAKNLFDFVTASAWNARKEGIDILRKYYTNENDIVDLFYAIANCHGTIAVNAQTVTVVLEPLQQRSRRLAQIDFCRYLTNMNAQTPNKKYFIVKVADN